MYFLLVIAFLSTLVYFNLVVSEIANSRINLFKNNETDNSLLISKIKYVLIIIMALSWAAIIKFL